MRFAPESLHGANNGLNLARELMQKIKEEFPWISYGDLWTLGGVAAIQEMAGPVIPWRPGRVDGFEHHTTPDGRLPDASQGSDHVRNVSVDHFYTGSDLTYFFRSSIGWGVCGSFLSGFQTHLFSRFNDQEIVALVGAHALGRCHTDRSGFEGPWTFSPITFSNDYYKLLFDEKWVWKKWNGPKQLTDKKTGTLMMLPADYVLVSDKEFKKHAQAYAKDQDLFFKE
jgi:cytochrome c peroxidase